MAAVDLAVVIALQLLEGAMWIVLYSIRPFRYMLRSDFRARVNAEFHGRSPFLKWLYLVSSSLLVLSSLFIIISLTNLFLEHKRSEPSAGERAKNQAISIAVRAFSKHASGTEK